MRCRPNTACPCSSGRLAVLEDLQFWKNEIASSEDLALAVMPLLDGVELLRACRVALASACNARRSGELLPTIACFCP